MKKKDDTGRRFFPRKEFEEAILKRYRKLPSDQQPYTEDEIVKAVEVFRLLSEKRNKLIDEGRWDPVNECPIDPNNVKSSDDSSK